MVNVRIGGQFELRRAALAALGAPEPRRGNWVTTARTALAFVDAALGDTARSQPVLLPCYVCAAVVQPFLQAGRDVRFYRIDERLRIDLDDLERRVRQERPAAVLFVQYFGVPVEDEVAAAFGALRAQTRVIEDCAQGGLLEAGTRMGSTGDFVITSLRKYLPVPDGALLVDRTGSVRAAGSQAPSPLAVLRLAGQTLRGLAVDGGAAVTDEEYVRLFERAEAVADAAAPREEMWSVSAALLAALDLEAARARRVANWTLLAQALAERAPELEPVLPVGLPEAASPLVLPLRVAAGRRETLRSALRARGVFCPVHWPLPDEVDSGDHPGAARLADEMLGLPIDQRYGEEEMAYVAAAVEEAWAAC